MNLTMPATYHTIKDEIPRYFIEHIGKPSIEQLLENSEKREGYWQNIEKYSPGLYALRTTNIFLPAVWGPCYPLRAYLNYIITELAHFWGADSEFCQITNGTVDALIDILEKEQNKIKKILSEIDADFQKEVQGKTFCKDGLVLFHNFDLGEFEEIEFDEMTNSQRKLYEKDKNRYELMRSIKNSPFIIDNMKTEISKANPGLYDLTELTAEFIIDEMNWSSYGNAPAFVLIYLMAKIFHAHEEARELGC
ncbi:MAG: hypothetical protein Q8Q23_00200 [bacterium]|nr:hypothetical protein [bacterium]